MNPILNKKPVNIILSKLIIIFSVLLVIFTSCKKNQPVGPEQSSIDRTPVLKATSTDVQLNEANYSDPAVNFTWTPGSNHGTNSAIDYTLQIDLKSDNFAKPFDITMGRNVYNQPYTVADFNALLLNQIHLAPDTNATLKVRLKSVTADSAIKADYSNVLDVKVTTYKPVSPTLFLIGDATPNGWDANNATPMKHISKHSLYIYLPGKFNIGQFQVYNHAWAVFAFL